jgi:hypothetical protein
MGNVHHGLNCHPWQSAARSGAIRLLVTLWATPVTLGLFFFALGGLLGAPKG